MALISDPDNLSQGASASAGSVTFTATGQSVAFSAAATMPTLTAGQYFVIRGHTTAVNNGLYKETGGSPTTSAVVADKISGSAPATAGAVAVTFLGSSADRPNIFYDTAARLVYLLEQNGLGFEGVLGQTVYSKMMIDWKDDAYLIAAAPFPMLCIDAFAGKYLIGQDASGNNNGWNWKDVTSPAIRTRKLLRNMGWKELDANGVTLATWAGIKTLGTFEDSTPATGDLAYYQFGTDTTVNDTVNFDFTGPVNEAIKAYEEIGNPPTCSFATTSTITRASGSFITDGYKVGGSVTTRACTTSANDGTYVLTGVAALTLTVTGTPLTASGADTAAQLSVNNLGALALRLRVRDADAKGKTYSAANLASGGFTALDGALFAFPLSNAADQKIDATDATIDGNAPYTGMTLTIHPTPQSLGGSGVLVGGPYNFGFTLDANGGTSQELHEWVQRQLRKTTDIDADASDAIGRSIDALGRFIGDAYKAGVDLPSNPQGGGSGVYVTGLAAVSKNSTTMYDNTGAERGFPVGTPVTLDFNQTLIDDTLAAFTLFFDRTIRNTVSDLAVTAGTGANGTFVSTANLPATLNRGVGAYVRVSGYTGGDAAMNGIYQVTALTSTSLWSVTRWDGATIVTAGAASCSVDENCVDTPDFIIVKDNVPADVTGLASVDYSFTFDYSNNVQGGRSGSTDAQVVARAVGQTTAQYTQSTVQTIESATAKTIPLTSNIERNFLNP